MRRLRLPLLSLGLLIVLACSAFSQGLLFVPEEETKRLQPLVTKTLQVSFDATESLATTKVKQTFYNPTSRRLEGRFIFPLPKGAAISNFAMWAGNKRLQARVLPKEQARRIYDDIVRKMLDPALLQYMGRGMFEARVFPIEPKSEKKIELEYSCVLEAESDIVEYKFPLNSSLVTQMPLMSFSIVGNIKSRDPLKNVYSPSHSIAFNRISEHEASVSYEGSDLKADRDFTLYYTLSRDEIGLSVLSHKDGDDGYFLLLAAPKYAASARREQAKQVVFVLDISGSMQGKKLEQARAAAKHIVSNLGPKDYFNLIAFNDRVRKFKDSQVPAKPGQITRALSFLDGLEAGGGTDINGSLREAVALTREANMARMIIFLTDGRPTVGETETARIIENIKMSNTSGTRIYGFGVGFDVGADLMDDLARESRGTVSYVLKDEDLERTIASFYNKVSYPVLSDISLRISGVKAFDIYPKEAPDLFRGSQLVMFGRYTGNGAANVRLSGKVGDTTREFSRRASFAGTSGEYSFIPRLWALRRVGFLLDKIRQIGENKELVDECTRLGTRYAIVTPYTSQLVTEDGPLADAELPKWYAEQRSAMPAAPRRRDTSTSLNKEQYKKTMAAAPSAPGSMRKSKDKIFSSMAVQELAEATSEKSQYTGTRKVIGKKTFVHKDGCWIDTAIESSRLEKPDKVVKFFSDEYFSLIDKEEELAEYLSAGKCLVVLHKGKVIKIEASDG